MKKLQKKNSAKELVTVKGVARRLIISERTVYNKVSNGTFPIRPIRVGRLLRFRIRDIHDYIDSL
jgi:excisionase family DNA binding protein